MTTVSYPAVGDEGYSADQWQAQFGSFEGILGDQGGAFGVTVNDGANTLTISPGKVQVAGYVLEVTVAEVLTVSTAAATYWVVAKYDPALNVADGGGDADPLGPCRLQLVSGTPSTTGGKAYVTLYKFTRVASQLLSDAFAGRQDKRLRLSPQLHVYNLDAAGRGYLETPTVGTVVRESSTGHVKVFERAPGDTDPTWVNHSRPVQIDFPKPGSLVAQDAVAVAYRGDDGFVTLRGTLKRSSGSQLNNGADVQLGTMPEGWRPGSGPGAPGNRRLSFQAAFDDNTRGTVLGYINGSGEVWMFSTSVPLQTPWVSGSTNQKNVQWIALDNNRYLAEQ